VEDASDDEEAGPDAQVTVENHIFLITIEDASTLPTTEVKVEEPPLTEDPLIVPSSVTIVSKGEDLACPPMHPSSSLTTTTRRRRKAYDRSSLHRSARLAQRSVLKDLVIVGNDGKLNESAIEDYADRLQQLLPPDLLKPLMGLKGRTFWDMMAEVSLHLSCLSSLGVSCCLLLLKADRRLDGVVLAL
jgi:hypothetical protein